MLRRVTCGVCGAAVEKARAKPTLGSGFTAVCNPCYELWSRSGRICAKCHTSVADPEHAGLFTDRRALGHAHCGGALVVA